MSDGAYWWEPGEDLFARGDAYRTRTIGECHQHDWRPTPTGGVCVNSGCDATVSAAEL